MKKFILLANSVIMFLSILTSIISNHYQSKLMGSAVWA